jgi:hypothetical protein
MKDQNIKQSFQRAKQDIVYLQSVISQLNENQKILIGWVKELREQRPVVHHPLPTIKRALVASKESNKVHASNCPFAKNIKPQTKQTFNAIEEATSYGYDTCACVEA